MTRLVRRRVRVTGTVQGVGFRPFVYRHATALRLDGWVANDSEGVVLEVQGPADRVDELTRIIRDEPPPLARVDDVRATELPADEALDGRPDGGGFRVVESRDTGAPAVGVSIDVATCDACLAELTDPSDRRYRYPFLNCTDCGPRYTIITALPYDRATTTMARFPMCDDCLGEYEDPANRRFHAEPTACPACGPRLILLTPDGGEVDAPDPLAAAVAMLRSGRILAVKGLGGYHLAVDAADEPAVAELRRRKGRDDKPFAVMVPDLATARLFGRLDPDAEQALASPRRPIVLAPRVDGAPVAPGVAPGLPELGLLLPYTPLHHLLLAGAARPLVMTSGNRSDEPIAHDDGDAVERLGPLVDALLVHDRGIHIRCDDSVVRSVPGRGVQPVRRSRGYAPEQFALPRPATRPLLAVGAELKNTVAVAKGAGAVVSHHIGDLEHEPAYRSFLQAVHHLCHVAGVHPEVVVHDLHPEYLSTKFAVDLDLPSVAVQHHHAHIASCLAEHRRADRVVGVAFDGLGLGTDGTLWGGEVLVADLDGFERAGHLRPVPLPGGSRAIREPWRMAMAWLHEAGGPDLAAGFGRDADERWRAVLSLVESGTSLTTTSAGRLFDAAAALLGVRHRITYEGQAAIELEALAAGVPPHAVPRFELAVDRPEDGGPIVLDPAPLLLRVLHERRAGTPVPLVAAGFHQALGEATADAAAAVAARHGLATVALSGGVFQNARLAAVVSDRLHRAGLEVLTHRAVPPNDGGISLGQAALAAGAG